MKARNTGGDINYDPAPAAMHIARCIRVVDLGTSFDDFYGREKHECWLMWELPAEMHTYTVKGKDGAPDKDVTEPFTVSKFYTLSLSEKAHLRSDLESWRGRGFTEQELEGFDMKALLGVPCMVNVIHKEKKQRPGKINAVVSSVTPLPKGLQCPPAMHDLIWFSLEEFSQADYDQLSKGIQQRIERSNEWHALGVQQTPAMAETGAQSPPAPLGADEFDDIPF